MALDADTREILGVYMGARDEAAPRHLWDSLPPVYRLGEPITEMLEHKTWLG